MEKKLREKIASVRAAHPAAAVELWAEDEARLGLKPITRRVWARRGRGRRPAASSATRYQWLYLYGFVRPRTGRSEWFLVPEVSAGAMGAALAEFAALVGAGPKKQIVLVVDGAGWHHAKALVVPAGLHLFALPAYTPELQPAERLWPPLREAIANESFADLAALEARLADRCQQLHAQPELIAALTRYHWWPKRY